MSKPVPGDIGLSRLNGELVPAILVIGAPGSGVEQLERVLGQLGLASVAATDVALELRAFNDRLLKAAGGSRGALPGVDPARLARSVRPFTDEARDLLRLALAESGDEPGAPWTWGDPALSILAAFWDEVVGAGSPVPAIGVYRPAASAMGVERQSGADSGPLSQWVTYNRSALVELSDRTGAIVHWGELLADPRRGAESLVEILAHCGIPAPPSHIEAAWHALKEVNADDGLRGAPNDDVPEPVAALEGLLDRIRGVHTPTSRAATDGELMRRLARVYDETYYDSSCGGPDPYRWDQPRWVEFFESMARSIVDTLHPNSVLDAGCAIGLLVSALRSQRVDAYGIDVSEWAIGQVPEHLRPFCSVASITDELPGSYDLITCIEVLEHLPATLAEAAVANLCRHTDTVLLSTTPDDFSEPTHLNVRGGGYWASLFLQQGFLRDPDYDAGFVSPQAVLLRRSRTGLTDVLDDYEAALARSSAQARQLAGRLQQVEQTYAVAQQSFSHTQKELETRLASTTADLTWLLNSRTYRYTAVPRQLYGKVRHSAAVRQTYNTLRRSKSARRVYRTLRKHGVYRKLHRQSTPARIYDEWVATYDTLNDGERQRIRERVSRLDDPPTISVIMPVYNPPPVYLRKAIESVRSQLYPHWQLCIADDHSTVPEVGRILEEYERADDRIRVVRRAQNGHISAASNSALEVATGNYVSFLDHDDQYAEHALALIALALADNPEAAIVYTDEDKIDDDGRRQDPYFKPDFDPLLLLAQNYLCHLLAVKRELVEQAGRLREGFEGSQDWDLVLRATELVRSDQIVHIPHVLYHWRVHADSTAGGAAAKPYAANAGMRAVEEHLTRLRRPAEVSHVMPTRQIRVRWPVPDPPPVVDIIIPTRDGTYLQRCIDSVLSATTYQNFEILVVDNGSSSDSTLAYLESKSGQGRIQVLRDPRPFNYSALNNAAVDATHGDMVCLLNDDTEVINGEWLDEMVGQLSQPGVGAVGAKLDFDDRRVQHGGVILGLGGVAGHAHRLIDARSSGYMGRLDVAQRFSAVTAACMLVRRDAWVQVGGLEEEHLAVAFNDVDFCLRLGKAGWSIVWTPVAELLHHESASRGSEKFRADEFAAEISYMQTNWERALLADPAYNPNLTLAPTDLPHDWSPAWPPRVSDS